MPLYVRSPGAGLGGWDTAHLDHGVQNLCGGDGGGQAIVLGYVPQACPYAQGFKWGLAQDFGAPGGRFDQTQKQLDGRAFACAVGPQQDGITVLHHDIYRLQGDGLPVMLGERFSFQ